MRNIRKNGVIVIFTIVFLIVFIANRLISFAATSSELQQQQQQNQEEIDETKREQEEVRSQLSSIQKEIEDLNSQISNYENEIMDLTDKITETEQKIQDAEVQLQETQKDLEEKELLFCLLYTSSRSAVSLYNRILKKGINTLELEDIRSTGYIVDTLEAVFWTFLNTDNFNQAIIGAINLGDYTDTIGACTGGLAGIVYGLKSINP